LKSQVVFSEEVAKAEASGAPIVALESTIIAHGMPYPQNVETARAVEDIIRENGAVPATIAVMDGVLKAGLSSAEMERFGKDGANIRKVSTRDLPARQPSPPPCGWRPWRALQCLPRAA
jgi:pseudouridylate synthase